MRITPVRRSGCDSRLKSDPAAIDPRDWPASSVYGLIWTTTPWTIPANLAIAFHPNHTYTAVEEAGDVYIVAEELASVTGEACDLETSRSGWPPANLGEGCAKS